MNARSALVFEGIALAALVTAQALLFGRLVGTDTDYDEGVYLSSLDALEHGQRLGEDVFAPQPPVFYLLLRGISIAGADTVRGFHWGMVAIAVGTCFAAYLLGRTIAGPLAGIIASALLMIAPPFPLYAHRVLADVPPLWLALIAIWLAWEAQMRRSVAIAACAGAVLTAAVCTKPNAILALPTFLVLLLWNRDGRGRTLASAAAGASAVAVALLVAYRNVLGQLWESVVVYHRDARQTPDVIDKSHELITFLNWRTPFAWLVVAGAVAAVVLRRRRHTPADWAIWLWAAISIVFLVFHHPLHENHLLILPVVLAVPAGIALAAIAKQVPWRIAGLATLALVLTAGYVQQQRRVALDDVPEAPELVATARLLERKTGARELVVSDQSIVPYIAGRVAAGPLVDTAVLRFETGSLTDGEVVRELEKYDVAAVVAGRAFRLRPRLLSALERRYGRPEHIDGIAVFVR